MVYNISSLTVEVPGASMVSSQECDENPRKMTDTLRIDIPSELLKVKTRKRKRCIQVVNITSAVLEKNMGRQEFEKKLKEIAEAIGGKPLSYSYPFERDKHHKYGEIITF